MSFGQIVKTTFGSVIGFVFDLFKPRVVNKLPTKGNIFIPEDPEQPMIYAVGDKIMPIPEEVE